jgi:hypothetical protein
MPARLLILACSQRKTDVRDAVPPIELYDGPAWRTLRAYLAQTNDEHLTVLALSASYGHHVHKLRLRQAHARDRQPMIEQMPARNRAVDDRIRQRQVGLVIGCVVVRRQPQEGKRRRPPPTLQRMNC